MSLPNAYLIKGLEQEPIVEKTIGYKFSTFVASKNNIIDEASLYAIYLTNLLFNYQDEQTFGRCTKQQKDRTE